MSRTRHMDRAYVTSGGLVVILLAAGLTMALLARSGSAIADLGLAVFGGAVVGGVFVVIEFQLGVSNQRRHDRESLLLQLTSTTDLAGIDLSDHNLAGTYLPGKNLVAARLDRAQLTGTQMYFADLRHSSLRSVNAVGCDLGGAVLDEADITGADLISADLSDTNIRNATLRGADLSNALVSNADLTGSDCRETRFTDTTIKHSTLDGVDFRDADLASVVFTEVSHDSATRWPSGFSPPPSVPVQSDWVDGTTLTDWLSLRRSQKGPA